jgi:protein involved in polysaccharide export with SLBB domain
MQIRRSCMNSFVPLLGAFAMMLGTGPLATISLSGAVNKPGTMEVTKPTTIRSFLKENGGLRPDADPKKIEVRASDGSKRLLDLTRFDQNETIRPGDMVTVPVMNPNDYVFVMGGVQNRGAVDYKDGMDIVTVVKEAGLPNEALKNQVKLIRGDTVRVVDLTKIESGVEANISLMRADRVEVPYAQSNPSNRDLLVGIAILVVLIFLLK